MIAPDDDTLAEDFARQISQLADGKPCDAVLLGLSLAASAVMRTAGEGDYSLDALGFAALLVNVHAGLDSTPAVQDVITTVGDGAPLTRTASEAATVLCAPLGLLMMGLLQHYDGRNVINSWLSVLLNALLDAGVDAAQKILRETADALPRAAEQMAALRAMDDGANTGQVGRA